MHADRLRHAARWVLFAALWPSLAFAQVVPAPTSAPVVSYPSSAVSAAGVAHVPVTLDATAGNAFRQQMSTPVVPVPTPGAGTDLADGVYVVGITAIDAAGGETMGGATATCTVTAGGAGGCSVAYTAVTGAESYRVYISAVNGAAPSRYFADVASPLNIVTLTGATVAAYPATSTAYTVNLAGDGTSWFKGGNFLRGIGLANSVPATTTNQLYNDAGTLTFNGSAVGSTYTGTANQVIVTGTVLSTPQDIGTASTPQFARLGLGQAADATVPLAILRAAIGVTTANGLVLKNTTPAAAGAQQYSPGNGQIGEGWSTGAGGASMPVETRWEVRPVQGAAAPTYDYVLMGRVNTGGWTDLLTVNQNGWLTLGDRLTTNNDVTMPGTAEVHFTARDYVKSSANGLLNVTDTGGTVGIQFNNGTAAPALTTCGTGAVTAGSRNAAGQGTATGATACTVTFGAPAWTNTPFCTVTDGTGARALWISGASTTAVTVNGLTDGDVFTWTCVGRI